MITLALENPVSVLESTCKLTLTTYRNLLMPDY